MCMKICDACRKKLSKEAPVFNPEPDSPCSEAEEAEIYVQTPEAVSSLNKCLVEIGESPYSKIMKLVARITPGKRSR